MAITGYSKLFGTIVTSTLWDEAPETCKVWITMLAICDQHGVVSATIPGLIALSRLPRGRVLDAIERLMAPDPDSRTSDHEGRRIERVEGGWLILNYAKYRDLMTLEERRARDAERKRRKRQSADSPRTSANVRDVSHTDPDPDPDPDQNHPLPPPTEGDAPRVSRGAFAPSARELEYRAAYAAGLPGMALRWPHGSQAALNAALAAHAKSRSTGKPISGEKLDAWITAAAEDFGAWLKDHPDEARFYASGEATGFAKWLNEDALRRESAQNGARRHG